MIRWVLLLFFTTTSFLAFADAGVERPQIEIGGGLETNPNDGMEVLLRVGIEGVTVHNDSGFTMVIARISGNLGFSTDPYENRLPYMDIEFVPAVVRLGQGLSGKALRVLPTRIGANIRLDEVSTVRVDVAGVEISHLGPSHFSERTLIYAKLAADALGFKMANYVSDRGAFHGVNVGALNGEAGLVIAAGESFKVRISFGGSVDVSLGGNVGGRFSVQSDLRAYNEVSLDIQKFLRFFVRNGVNGAGNSPADLALEYQLMAGATFIF